MPVPWASDASQKQLFVVCGAFPLTFVYLSQKDDPKCCSHIEGQSLVSHVILSSPGCTAASKTQTQRGSARLVHCEQHFSLHVLWVTPWAEHAVPLVLQVETIHPGVRGRRTTMFFTAASSSSTWRSRLLCECHLWLLFWFCTCLIRFYIFSCLAFLIEFSKLYVPTD